MIVFRRLALGLALVIGLAHLAGCGNSPAPTEAPKADPGAPKDGKEPAKKGRVPRA